MKLEGKNILVTGGAGFIGSHLVDALMSKGCRVRVFDNLANGSRENVSRHEGNSQFEFVLGSVLDASAIHSALKDIDIVFHLACLGVRHSLKNPFENHRVNAEGTLIALRTSHEAGIKKFIHCSSSEVYGTAEYVPMPESHPLNPTTVYGAGKLAGEMYARAFRQTYGMDTTVLRPFNTYGPRSHHEGDAGEVIPRSIVRTLSQKPIVIFGDGSQTRDFTYVKDMAGAFIKATELDSLIGSTVNIGSGFEITIEQTARMVLGMMGASASQIEYLKGRPADTLRLYADSSVFRKASGWEPEVSFEEGLKATIEWFKRRRI